MSVDKSHKIVTGYSALVALQEGFRLKESSTGIMFVLSNVVLMQCENELSRWHISDKPLNDIIWGVFEKIPACMHTFTCKSCGNVCIFETADDNKLPEICPKNVKSYECVWSEVKK